MDGFEHAMHQRITGPAADAYKGEDNPSGEVRFRANKFRCPHCQALAHQEWWDVEPVRCVTRRGKNGPPAPSVMGAVIEGFGLSECQGCHKYSLWVNEKLAYPGVSTAPLPVEDMPADVRADYNEAREIFDKSARGAGGLLRLAFEKLLQHLGVTKSDPNAAIGELVKKGLVLGPMQQAMDSMRIFSNQAVHHGFVKLEDQPATVALLFRLINYIVVNTITRDKEIQALYNTLPPEKLAGIQKRDGTK
jgi:hypothetical protein